MTSTEPAPNVYPVLRYADPAAAIRFLIEAFGFREHAVHTDPSGLVAHAELSFGGSMVMLGPSAGAESVIDTGRQSVYVAVDDVDSLHDRAVDAGAEIVFPLTDQDYGSRDFSATDPAGHVWSFGTYRPNPT